MKAITLLGIMSFLLLTSCAGVQSIQESKYSDLEKVQLESIDERKVISCKINLKSESFISESSDKTKKEISKFFETYRLKTPTQKIEKIHTASSPMRKRTIASTVVQNVKEERFVIDHAVKKNSRAELKNLLAGMPDFISQYNRKNGYESYGKKHFELEGCRVEISKESLNYL